MTDRGGEEDRLLGLKENIILGHLIPAGTGMYRYNDVDVEGAGMPVMEGAEAGAGGFALTGAGSAGAEPDVASFAESFGDER